MNHGGPAGDDQPLTIEATHPPAVVLPDVGPVPPRRPRRRWRLWAALGAVLLVLSGGIPAVLLTGVLSDVEVGEPATAASPTENPTTIAARQVAERIAAQLDKQAAALLSGDRSGFLGIAANAARSDLRQRYAALRALRVTRWEARPSGLPTTAGKAGEWRLAVEFQYCFVVPDCRPSPLIVETRWRDGAEPRLLALGKSKPAPTVGDRANGQPGSLPWEVSALVTKTGKRTIVAVPPAYRHRLAGLSKRAEAAAKVADEYVVAGTKPDRYRIFYAGPKEWKRWYGGDHPKWSAGYAVNVGGGHYELVLAPDSFDYGPGLDTVLRHELAHAATLPEKRDYSDESSWWLVEGLAELAAADGQSVARYSGLSDTRRLVKGDWDGKLDTLAPDEDTSDAAVTGSYGIAYLAARYFLERFGEERLLAFAKVVLHDRRIPRQTSEEIFDESWASLHKECVAYIRGAVR
ncbi:hypothetical protein [Micromonospora lutea]|uniref:Peptidase MA superfamily n=1 Tax=Micromonospora lutea TaxID=419825 RepID=A0ABQ4IUQ7_9ACTN|nr:hypothetical protein [Micromonospora lutea]GIJ21655.1 hypothetical protein Vlu01_22790 [Micromonospora lutea]